jgi:hypothetical protein
MPTSTPNAPLTLPSQAEIEKAVKLLSEANEALCDLAWVVRRIGDVESIDDYPGSQERKAHERHPDDEVPSYESIGRMYSAAATMRGYVEEMTSAIADIGGPRALYNLDSVRVEVDYRGSKQ